MKKMSNSFIVFMVIVFLILGCGNGTSQTVGWAIGTDETGVPAIVNTKNGGQSWQQQGEFSVWKGQEGCDISAVDDVTAWAALGDGAAGTKGAILHTTDGGATWISQTLPDGLLDGIKGIKGLSRSEAWAASLHGTILHTTDSGTTWTVIPHPMVPIKQVNRIDAQGTNVWIADCQGDIVHTPDIGMNWYAERLPKSDSPLTVHVYNSKFVWASGAVLDSNPTFYRTTNWGKEGSWDQVITLGALDHLDDICVADPNNVWGVQNGDGVSGFIWRIHVTEKGVAEKTQFKPPELSGYTPGGVTCMDREETWVAAQRGVTTDPKKPSGIILYKKKHEEWVLQKTPTQIRYWKISFAGARR